MSVDRAVGQLSAAVEELWSAVGELVLIVLEDQPQGEGLAVGDDLVETVSELQGAVAAARAGLAAGPPGAGLADLHTLPEVAMQLRSATARYWRDVRAHEPVAQLRAGTRTRGGEWPSWRRSVEQSAARCAEPFEAVSAALDASWHELCRLAGAGTPDGSHSSSPGTPPSPFPAPPTRRIP
jgi:hypothetical protein